MEGAEREFAEVPEFKRKKGERQADFMHRVDTTTTMAIKESQIEASFKVNAAEQIPHHHWSSSLPPPPPPPPTPPPPSPPPFFFFFFFQQIAAIQLSRLEFWRFSQRHSSAIFSIWHGTDNFGAQVKGDNIRATAELPWLRR